jgi:wyosine [tRNA(Phe)-imidazoG37] synthetase (radical SAM superfamily)
MKAIFAQHDRLFEEFRYVYPVISRRSGGLSLGINLNPACNCTFSCIYCQVNPDEKSTLPVDLDVVFEELDSLLISIENGDLKKHPRFSSLDQEFLIPKDIAIAGNGEPTISHVFADFFTRLQELSNKRKLPPVVIFTNGTMLHKNLFQQSIPALETMQCRIWGKLDCGTQGDLTRIHQTKSSIEQILKNYKDLPESISLTLQTCLFKHKSKEPDEEMLKNLIAAVQSIRDSRPIDLWQIYTIARPPRDCDASALSLKQLEQIKAKFSPDVDFPIELYSGSAD